MNTKGATLHRSGSVNVIECKYLASSKGYLADDVGPLPHLTSLPGRWQQKIALAINQHVSNLPKSSGIRSLHFSINDVLGDKGKTRYCAPKKKKGPTDENVFVSQNNWANLPLNGMRMLIFDLTIRAPFLDETTFHGPLNAGVDFRFKWMIAWNKHRNRITVEMLQIFKAMYHPIGNGRVVHSMLPGYSNCQMIIMGELSETFIDIRTNVESIDYVWWKL